MLSSHDFLKIEVMFSLDQLERRKIITFRTKSTLLHISESQDKVKITSCCGRNVAFLLKRWELNFAFLINTWSQSLCYEHSLHKKIQKGKKTSSSVMSVSFSRPSKKSQEIQRAITTSECIFLMCVGLKCERLNKIWVFGDTVALPPSHLDDKLHKHHQQSHSV